MEWNIDILPQGQSIDIIGSSPWQAASGPNAKWMCTKEISSSYVQKLARLESKTVWQISFGWNDIPESGFDSVTGEESMIEYLPSYQPSHQGTLVA